jgi:hypothetical protein
MSSQTTQELEQSLDADIPEKTEEALQPSEVDRVSAALAMAKQRQKPSIGRIVEFTFGSALDQWRSWKSDVGQSEVVPAIITQVWSDTCVNLTVFIDGEKCTLSRLSVVRVDRLASNQTDHDSWRWPDRV